MEKKKLLVTGSTFPRWKEDTEPRFILDYAKSMTKYFDVTVLVPAAPGAKDNEELEGVNVVRYHYFPIHKFETLCYPGAIVPRIKEKKIRLLLVPFLLISMRHALKEWSKKVDVVHAHWLIPQGIVQSSIKSTPYIVTGHGGDVTGLNFEPIKSMKRKTLKNAKGITTVSGAMYEYIQQLYPNDKTEIISMGCDTTSFSPDNRTDNYFGQGEKKTILFVGRLAEIKGVKYLIEAMKDIDDAILYIVGKGDIEPALREQAKKYGNKVVFLGPKTHEELTKIYPSADVLVVPSITTDEGAKEGFGLVILEALASGTPVVASNSGGIPDIITNYKNGILCEEKDSEGLAKAINLVIRNHQLRESLVKEGIETADRYSYEKIAKRYYLLMERLMK